MKEPKILSVADWGGKLVKNGALPKHKAAGIVIHHTADPNREPEPVAWSEVVIAKKKARDIQAFHMGPSRSWRDTGQHFLNSRGGVLLEGRNGTLAAAREGLVIQGAHAGEDEHNQTCFGIENEGNTELAPLTGQQWQSLVSLCAWLSYVGNFQSSSIIGHRQLKSTACPGKWLFDNLPRLRHDVREAKLKLLKGGDTNGDERAG